MKLFEIKQELENCVILPNGEAVNTDTGEIIDINAIEALQMEFDEKVANILLWMKNLKADSKAYKEQKDHFAAMQKSADSKYESLKNYASYLLAGEKWDKDPGKRVKVSWRSSESVDVNIDELMKYDNCDSYLRYKAPEPNKEVIKEALKSGIEVPGCSLISNSSMILK